MPSAMNAQHATRTMLNFPKN